MVNDIPAKKHMKDEMGIDHAKIEKEGDVCEICGNYSDDLKDVNGQLICEECSETSTESD